MFGNAPPGPVLILRYLPSLLFPFALVLASQHAYQFWSPHTLDPMYLKYAYAFCVPVVWTAIVLAKDWKDTWDAWRHGAVMPPRRGSIVPGNWLAVLTMVIRGDPGYLGLDLEEILSHYNYFFNFRTLFTNRFVIAEPEFMKYILATRFDNHEKGHPIRDSLKPLLGVGVFASDGEMWKFHRQLTRPFFARDRISDFETFERHSLHALDLLKGRLREGYAVDFQDLVSKFTLDSATEFLFAKDLQSLSAGLPYPHNSPRATLPSSSGHSTEADKFAQAFNYAAFTTSRRVRFGELWPLFEFWKDRAKEPMNVIYSVIQPIITAALERKAKRGEKTDEVDGEEQTLIDFLVTHTDDPIIIRDEVLNILIAGRDTTAGTLTLVIYMLAQHPHVLQKLRHEITSKLGSRQPTLDDFKDMKYLRAVINETLRLYPVVPFNLKSSIKPQIWPRPSSMQSKPGVKPFWIPANTRMPQVFISLHRRKDLWGPDALEFDPDRFLDHRLHKYLVPNPYIFVPFNAGPRICLGQQFAYHEASYFLVRLLQTFSAMSLALDAQPPETLAPPEWKASTIGRQAREKVKMGSHLTVTIHGGLWVRMEEVNEAE